MAVPRNPVTPEPFCKQWKAETKDNQTSPDILLQECKEGLGHEETSTPNPKDLTQL